MPGKLKYAGLPILLMWLMPSAATAQSFSAESLATPSGATSGWLNSQGVKDRFGQVSVVTRYSIDNLVHYTRVYGISLYGSTGVYAPLTRLVGERPTELIVRDTDIDGDGRTDILLYSRDYGTFEVLLGSPGNVYKKDNLQGSFPKGLPSAVGTADLDGDGLPEMLVWVHQEGGGFLNIMWNRPGQQQSSSSYPFIPDARLIPIDRPTIPPHDFIFGDYNGDGRTDFLFKGTWFVTNADLSIRIVEAPVFTESKNLILGAEDLEGDGKTEILILAPRVSQSAADSLIVANLAEEDVITLSSGYGIINKYRKKATIFTGVTGITDYRFGEFTGDRNADLVFFSSGQGNLTISRGGSGFTLGAPEVMFTGLKSAEFLGARDLQGDGFTDWLFLDAAGQSLKFFIQQQRKAFTEKTTEAGINRLMAANAAAVGDFNNDGNPDVYVVNGTGPNALFAGSGTGFFSDEAEKAGVATVNDGISCAWGDYDNDGLVDLVVAGLSLPDRLFRNNGNGTFADSSQILNLSRGTQRATSVCWGDVNLDGYLDLLIANFDGPNWLLINENGRRFKESAVSRGLTGSYNTESAVLVDVDSDGLPDVVSLNAESQIRLYLNTGKGNFADRTQGSGLNPVADEVFKFGQSQSWGDYNGDGRPDLFVSRAQGRDMLFNNLGGGKFELAATPYLSPNDIYGKLGSCFADLNGDGWPDLFIARTSRFGILSANPTDILVLDPGNYAPERTFDHGLNRPVDTSLPLAADFDLDGDVDLMLLNYLADNPVDLFRVSAIRPRYMENQIERPNSIRVKLGRTDRASIVGARVIVAASGKTFLQTVSGGAGRMQTGQVLVFPLGDNTSADSVVVYWPQPQKSKKVVRGPVFPGVLEVTAGPVITPLSLPGQLPPATLPSGVDTFYAEILVADESPIGWVRSVVLRRGAQVPDTIYAKLSPVGKTQLVPIPGPAVGDSISYYLEAADIYGNVSRWPQSASQWLGFRVSATLVLGDLNADRVINIFDLLRLSQIIGGKGTPTQHELAAADLNRDGKIDINDLLIILTKLNTRY